MVKLDNWQARMVEDMKLRDFRPTTRKAYLGAVRQFSKWLRREPATWTEEDVRRYILYLRDDKQLSFSSINVAVHALKFFVSHTLRVEWPVMDLLHVRRRKTLPVVLSRREVKQLLSVIRQPMQRIAFTAIYGLGLRIGEALRLEAGHIDGDRLVVTVRDAKGGRDRAVTLPRPLLERLRYYWRAIRPRVASPSLFIGERTNQPPHPTLLQKTFKAALRDAKVCKPATVHTLRHSYATHLLERGVSIRVVQRLLGHQSVMTTMGYVHVGHDGGTFLQDTLDALILDL